MTVLQAVILGIVQGLTEFLPVSSSAHLVIVPWALGWEFDPAYAFAFDVLVQMGTLLAVVVYFARTLREMLAAVGSGLRARRPFVDSQARLGWLILVATLPAVVAGLLVPAPLVTNAQIFFARVSLRGQLSDSGLAGRFDSIPLKGKL